MCIVGEREEGWKDYDNSLLLARCRFVLKAKEVISWQRCNSKFLDEAGLSSKVYILRVLS